MNSDTAQRTFCTPSSRWVPAATLAFALGLGALVLCPERAFAESIAAPSENPKKLWEEGEALEAQRLFLPALTKYERSYELSKNFGLLFVIGRVKEKLPDYVGALTAYEQYVLAEENKERRDRALSRIEAIKAAVATVSVATGEPDVEVTISGRLVGRSPFTKPILLNPGTYEIVATKPGFVPQRKSVQLSVGERFVTRFDLVPDAPAQATVVPSGSVPLPLPVVPPKRDTTWIWVGWTTTAALAIGAGTLGLLSLTANKDLRSARDRMPASASNFDSLATKTRSFAIGADVLSAASLVMGSISLYLTLKSPGESKASIQVGPTGISLQGAFR